MTLRLNPPPGWPSLPEDVTPLPGWPSLPEDVTPPPGWPPDPSWPLVPDGWPLWVDAGRPASGSPAPRTTGPPAPRTSGAPVASLILGIFGFAVLAAGLSIPLAASGQTGNRQVSCFALSKVPLITSVLMPGAG